tara:strand:+ start:136 stop:933 length:798 start_codon:yes stop_codon:yes gene_type:complete
MAYLPKSKYSLSKTSGREFMYAFSKKEYVGDYIIMSNKNFFAGNNINNIQGSDLLIPIQKSKNYNTYIIKKENGTFKEDYINLNRPIFTAQDNFHPILSTKPTPTEKDYLKGYFYRYVAKRINTDTMYYEIDKKTYKSIKSRENKYDSYLHECVKIKWNITETSGKINHLTIRKIQRTTSLKKLSQFFNDINEYQLSTGLLNQESSPLELNTPKAKLIPHKRHMVAEAQKGAIDIIKEKSRKNFNSGGGTSGGGGGSSGGGGGGY